ncbi:LacI family DNA-binding transcriptional regulator [Microbispora bryophytorum]|uniref:LacI family DNA-binding transcriptional regulator n=1 Tax=Microbispora bryophytorum TaxID=1460882 RepID=UPI0033C471F1
MAALAGVSRQTVTRALNDMDGISDETKNASWRPAHSWATARAGSPGASWRGKRRARSASWSALSATRTTPRSPVICLTAPPPGTGRSSWPQASRQAKQQRCERIPAGRRSGRPFLVVRGADRGGA